MKKPGFREKVKRYSTSNPARSIRSFYILHRPRDKIFRIFDEGVSKLVCFCVNRILCLLDLLLLLAPPQLPRAQMYKTNIRFFKSGIWLCLLLCKKHVYVKINKAFSCKKFSNNPEKKFAIQFIKIIRLSVPPIPA